MEQQSPPPEKPPENTGGMTRILIAVAIGLAVMIAVIVLVNQGDGSAGTVDEGRVDWSRIALALATLTLVAGGSWGLLRRLTPATFLRNIGIWLVVGLGAAGLYLLLYPNGPGY
jgi:hypothetical protein